MKIKSPDTAATVSALENADLWHQQWKDKLRAAVADRATLDPVVIMCEDCCMLGKWLNSDGEKAYWHKPEFQELLLNHREFHMLAGAIAEIINDKQYDLATAYLSNDTQFANASKEVSLSIRRLEAAVAA
jgi:hypothetical protein